ncbi:hypothetical protein RB595_001200 [Gaeumannomyces hyphopodioides]
MAGPSPMLGASATPTQKSFAPQPASGAVSPLNTRPSLDRDALLSPAAGGPNGASSVRPSNLSTSSVSFSTRGLSMNQLTGPGSFSSDLRSHASAVSSRAVSRGGEGYGAMDRLNEGEDDGAAEKNLASLRETLKREIKIKEGSENMLEALNSKKAKQAKDQRQRVEAELKASNQRIRLLTDRIAEAEQSRTTPLTPSRTRADVVFQSSTGLRSPRSASRSGAGSDLDEPTESPTFALAEILQALEVDGMNPAYYVGRANNLVDLFKRHPTLKYDLVWSVFGLRTQAMLLSDSREVVAASYRMTRYAISDVSSLKKIRTLNTDYIVVHSLSKDRKADLEREQALKFVRAFLDVKDGVRELSRAVVRTIAAVAEQPEDRLRSICLETLAEILIKDPPLLVSCGGLGSLSEAMGDGSYKSPESLTGVLLYLLDSPQRRKYLRPGYELEVLFTVFTDQFVANEKLLKQNSRAIATALKTWSGLLALSMYNFRAVRSLVGSLVLPSEPIRESVVELLYSLLRIKSPAWASSFLAGRRLTTYGRVANLKSVPLKSQSSYVEDDAGEQNFVEHYTALLLAIFIKNGLLPALLGLVRDAESPTLKRKTTLLIGEVLRLSSRLLPTSWSNELQLLPELFAAAARFDEEEHFIATGMVYQISSISKTLHRSSPSTWSPSVPSAIETALAADEQPRTNTSANLDDAAFRQLLIESAVLSSSNYNKWRWDVVLRIIEGPLTSGKRLEEALKASKFVKRVVNFFRPFKYKFSEVPNTRNAQKYIRAGCALMHTFLQTPEGVRYLMDSKLLRQIAECLAQCDPTSGISAQFLMFSKDRLSDTLRGGYITMLGVLSSDPKGLQMLDRWRVFNMMYHIVDLKQRPDMVKLLLSNLDYGLQGHPRVLLSKALTSGTKDIRIHATNILRKYTTAPKAASSVFAQPTPSQNMADFKWAIQLLVTQLYDPDVEVCATAVKILEKACNTKDYLEYLVECRPALDHLGEIGAPLLLRFLSSSIGYHYLDGLDYISNEMDDWFLGRNDSYVALIEASLGRAFLESTDDQAGRMSVLDEPDADSDAHIPPHFYRELTRTREGCKLLADKGHFDEFVTTIREHGMQSDDFEVMVKVKACLWAVGNVGSMELGAPFLESCDVVDHIVKIAQEHEMLSLRGTAFFVLGLISRSIHGLEILSEHGWDSNTNMLGESLGFCLPSDLSKFFSVKPWRHETPASIRLPSSQKTIQSEPPAMPNRPRSESIISALGSDAGQDAKVELDADPMNQRILELVIDLGNVVLWKRAMQSLMQLKHQKKAPGFRQPRVFRKVMALLECHHYRLPSRMVLDLFDKSVLRRVVFEEDGDDDQAVEGQPTGDIEGERPPRERDTEDEDSDEDSDDDDDDDDESSDDEEEYDDDGRTERQRSISDPPILASA